MLVNLVNWFAENPMLGSVAVVAATLAAANLLLAFLARVYPILRWKEQGYPYEEQIERLLLPVIFETICAIFKFSDHAVDTGLDRLHAVDKTRLVDYLYNSDLLPDVIRIPLGALGWNIEWRKYVSQEAFGNLVKGAYDKFVAQYERLAAAYEDAYNEWLEENAEDRPVFGPPPGDTD